MKVREFFENYNTVFVNDIMVYIHDVRTNTAHSNRLKTIMENADLYNDWKNATIYSWSLVGKEFVFTVEKED